jgi:DNA-binding transcriptional LysR family regulator
MLPPREPRTLARDHRYKDIQLPQLRSFCLMAIEGNFTSAAAAQGLSTSTVWQQVRALERELGTTLLRRRGRLIELTSEGRLLLEMIQPHVSGLDSLRHFFEARRKDLPHEFVLASGAYLLANHLPGPIREFRAARPDVSLTLRIAAWTALRRLIERREADIAVLATDPEGQPSPHLEYEHLFDEQYCLLTPARHPLARRRKVSIRDLVAYPLIIPPVGGVDRRTLDRLLQKHGLADRLQVAVVSGLADVTKRFVAEGVGLALMYLPTETDPHVPGLHVRPFDPALETLAITVAVRKGTYLPDYVQEFRRAVRRSCGRDTNKR